MSFKIKFNSEEASTGFQIVEEGKYEVTIVSAEAKEWQGNYSIGFGVEIRSDVQQKFQGSKILYNTIYLNSTNPEYAESTQKKLNAFLAACGYTGNMELDLDEVVVNIIGKSVLAYVKHRTNNDGKTFPYVSFVGTSKEQPAQQQASNNNGPLNVEESELPF